MSKPLPPRLARATIPAFALHALRVLQQAGHHAFLVGGCVRDILRGVPPKDYDITTSALPPAVMALFPKTVPTGIQHGTVTVVTDRGVLEVTTFRGEEGYQDGRRPDRVVFLPEVEGDLARRDFTFNAIAFDPIGGELVDPFQGALDLAVRRIRCVGNPDHRFGEDGLRPLRAVRLASVLRMEIDPPTFEAIPRTLPIYQRVASERVANELGKLLAGPRPSRGLRLLAASGLATRILPALLEESPACLDLRLRRVDRAPRGLRWVALFVDHPESLRALKPPSALLQQLQSLTPFLDVPDASATDAGLRRYVARVGRPLLHPLWSLQRAELGARSDQPGLQALGQLRRRTLALLASNPPLSIGDLALNGTQVAAALCIAPGPQVGKALGRLLEAVLEDPSANTPEALAALLGSIG